METNLYAKAHERKLTFQIEERPDLLEPIFDNIPIELRDRPQWVAWQLELRKGKWTKPPLSVRTGKYAKSTDERTWATFDEAKEFAHEVNTAGVGYVLSEPYTGIDFDDCRNPVTGEIEPWATDIISRLNSYTEVSPSKTGLKTVVRGRLPRQTGKPLQHKRNGLGQDGLGAIEVYDQDRFFTLTGHVLNSVSVSVEERQEELDELYVEWFPPCDDCEEPANGKLVGSLEPNSDERLEDDDVIGIASNAANGDKFRRLFFDGDLSEYHDDHSRADQALCNMLAFYCGPDSEEQIDRLFHRSALYRDKWDRPDYRAWTIGNALDNCDTFYESVVANLDRMGRLATQIVGSGDPPEPPPFVADVEPPEDEEFEGFYEQSRVEKSAATRTKRWFTLSELQNRPPVNWLIEGHLVCGGTAFLLGESGAGKSFCAIDQGLCIATGKPYLGAFEVEPGAVAYIGEEGNEDFSQRMLAWQKYHDRPETPNFCYIPEDFDLKDDRATNELIKLVRDFCNAAPDPLRVVIIDTFFNMLCGGDENSPTDVGAALNNIKRIRTTLDTSVICLHHPGHKEKHRPRGHSSIRPALNSITLIEGGIDSGISVRNTKQKNGPAFPTYTLNFKIVDTGIYDEYGNTITVPVATDITRGWAEKSERLKEGAKKLMFKLHSQFGLQEFGRKDYLMVGQDVERNELTNEPKSDRTIERWVDSLAKASFVLVSETMPKTYRINPKAEPSKATFQVG